MALELNEIREIARKGSHSSIGEMNSTVYQREILEALLSKITFTDDGDVVMENLEEAKNLWLTLNVANAAVILTDYIIRIEARSGTTYEDDVVMVQKYAFIVKKGLSVPKMFA